MTEAVVTVARSWIGTPYIHQASEQSFGTDCLGLVRGVWRTLYGAEPERVPAYSMDWSEPQGDEALLRVSQKYFVQKPLSEPAAGDLLVFRMRSGAVAKHVGIQSSLEPARFIHAYSRRGVVESPLTQAWTRKVVARFAFPKRS